MNRGISLIEVLITLLIVVLALVGILQSYIYSVYLSQLNRDFTFAVNDAQDIMEAMRSTSFSNLVLRFPHGVADGPAGNPYQLLAGGYSLNNEAITVTYANAGVIPLEIIVTVQWGDMRFVTRSFALTTMRAR